MYSALLRTYLPALLVPGNWRPPGLLVASRVVTHSRLCVQDSNTELRQAELKSAVGTSSQLLRGSVDDLDAGARIIVGIWVADGVGQVCQLGLSASLDTLEVDSDGDRSVVSGVVNSTLPDQRAIAGLVDPGAPVEWAVG